MNWTMVFWQILIMMAGFTVLVFLMGRHPENDIDNYPPDIQQEYFRNHPQAEPKKITRLGIIRKIIALILFALILAVLAKRAGGKSFKDGFVYAALLFIIIGCYDTFFLDWVLFANLKMFRLPSTEHMDKAYHQKWFHLRGMLFPGSLYLLIMATLCGLVLLLLQLI